MNHLEMNFPFWWSIVWASTVALPNNNAALGTADFIGAYIMGGEI